jgi:hypothetical protein
MLIPPFLTFSLFVLFGAGRIIGMSDLYPKYHGSMFFPVSITLTLE